MKIRFAVISILVSTLTACGGGGGGGGGGGPSQPDVFYVRATAGSDANDGMTAATAFQTINAAISALTDGDTVIVGPGTYNETIDLNPPGGTEQSPILFQADPSGSMTADPPGPVILNGRRNGSTIRLTNFPYTTIDGFQVTGASGNNNAAIQIRTGSDHVTVQNCIVRDNVDDPGTFVHGIRVQDSDDALIFNNLVHDNSGQGIGILGNGSGSQRARVINNTVVRNNRGISIGTGNTASADAFLLNNIFQNNVDGQDRDRNVVISEGPPSSIDGYDAQHNLVFPSSYNPTDLPRPTDINEDALFVEASGDNFRLSQPAGGQEVQSPAVDAGSIDGVPGSPVDFSGLLLRTTASNGQADAPPIDLGFHDLSEPAGGGLTFYVRAAAGDDSNNGMSPGEAFKTISTAVTRAFAGDVIVVGPGQYNEAIINPPSGEAGKLLTFLGDPTGRLTGDADIAGPVTVDANGQRAAFSLAGAEFLIIEGFTVTGGSEAGIEVRSDSSNLTIRNCESLGNPDNGILIRDSSSVLVFNNLVARNDGTGILVGGTSGSHDVQVVNNTVANNGDRGIRVGEGSATSTDVLLQNNIIQDNDSAGLQANEQSVETLQVAFNLVLPENYIPQQIQGPNDINDDAEFVGPDDYHLVQATSPAVDAGDPATDVALANALSVRTTDPDGARDMGRVDLGYHYAIP